MCLRMWTVVSSSRPAASAMLVMMSWAPLTLSRCPRWLRNRAGVLLAPGQSARSVSQSFSAACSCGWIGTCRPCSPFPDDPQDAFAGGAGDVVDVERDDLADPYAGVERDEPEGLVARRWAGLHGSEVSELRAVVERARCGGRDLDSGGACRPEPATDVEVVDRGKRVVDGRGATLENGLQVGAVVAHRPVAAVRASERVLVEVRGGEPRQVLTDFRGVCAPRLIRQRR